MNLQVVQSCEDAFSADPQTSCDDSQLQKRVGLQRRFEQRADEADHLVVETFEVGILQRHVIFVDEDDDVIFMVTRQAGAEYEPLSVDVNLSNT